jgi:hypothetical protein
VWDFGDGQTQTTTGPTAQHTYALPRNYSVALTVVDQIGCGLTVVYTGQTASCNGSAKARTTQTITVPQQIVPLPLLPPLLPLAAVDKESISPRAFPAAPSGPSAQSAKKKKKRTYGTKVTYTLNVAASVRFIVQRSQPGRKVRHGKVTTCDPLSRHNATKKKCTRIVTLNGSFTGIGVAGTNTFRFTGRLNAKRLTPGKYTLVATPTANGKIGRSATASFKIIR